MDGTVIGFFALVCLGTGIIFGLAPALHVSKTDVNEVLKEGGRSGTAGVRARRWTGALMVAELTLTVVLLAGAGFMMRNFLTLYRLDLGIDTSKLLTMALALPERKYPAVEQRLAFYERLEERLQVEPEDRSRHDHQQRADAGRLPAQADDRRQAARSRAAGAERDDADDRPAVLQDRRPAAAARPRPDRRRRHDRARERRSSISASWRLHFPNEDPIGRRITLAIDLQGGAAPQGGIPLSLTATIVGVVPNLRQRDFQLPDPDPIAYLPFRTDPRGFMNLLVRSSGDPNADDADPARGSARDRSRSAAVRHSHDGCRAGAGALAVPDLRQRCSRSSR